MVERLRPVVFLALFFPGRLTLAARLAGLEARLAVRVCCFLAFARLLVALVFLVPVFFGLDFFGADFFAAADFFAVALFFAAADFFAVAFFFAAADFFAATFGAGRAARRVVGAVFFLAVFRAGRADLARLDVRERAVFFQAAMSLPLPKG